MNLIIIHLLSVTISSGEVVIGNPYVLLWVLAKVKNVNLKMPNLISGINEIRFLVQHELFECK